MISDIIALSNESVLVRLQLQGNIACFEQFTIATLGSRTITITTIMADVTITNTTIMADVTISGLDLCSDMLGFRALANGKDFNSTENQTSAESELPKLLKPHQAFIQEFSTGGGKCKVKPSGGWGESGQNNFLDAVTVGATLHAASSLSCLLL